MPLSSDSRFGVKALTQAINALPTNPTQIRALGQFKPTPLATTYVEVELQEGALRLVKSEERGTEGKPAEKRTRTSRLFSMLHLPKKDIIRADDIQNLRAFGSTEAQTIESAVNDKLADMKSDIEYTREHLMLGALQGKILDADGTVLFDIYKEFGLTRKSYTWDLDTAGTEVGAKIDKTVSEMRKGLKGETFTKFAVLCSPEFMEKLKYHPSIKALYERYRDGAAYREADLNQISFEHNGVQFIQYDGDFGADGAKIAAGEGIILPLGTRNTFAEYFAPADMSGTVNTKALPYYASREKLKHDKGWDLEAQSNPLPLVMRPNLVATVKV